MKRACTLLMVVAGCGGGEPPGPMYGGGTIMVPQCGYSVTSRDGISAPVLGTPSLGSDATPWGIHLGIAGDASTTMVVSWRTKDEETKATTVQFGTGGKTDQTVEGLTFAYETGNPSKVVRVHEAHLCGLAAATVYSYRVGGRDAKGNEKWSEVSTFRTAPDKSAQVVIAEIGDSRDGYAIWGQLLAKAQSTGAPDLIVFTGDAITLGYIQDEWDEWFRQAEPVLKQVPMVAELGNHEANAIHYFAQLALPGDEEHWGLDYGPVHISAVNDTPPDPGEIASKAAPFLEKDLTASAGAPWHFAMHHRGLYSSSTHGGDPGLRAAFGPIYDSHKVDLVMNGHDHDYERSKPMKGGMPQATAAEGTVYLVVGGAGAPMYPKGTTMSTAVSAEGRNFALLRVRTGMLQMMAYDDKGTVIDSLDISK